MKAFAALYSALDETNKTNEKVAAMVSFFRDAPAQDAAWAVHFLVGRRPKRLIGTQKLFAWAAELAGLPEWLMSESYDAVGDLAETIALVLPEEGTGGIDWGLEYWVVNRLLPIAHLEEPEQKTAVVTAWTELDRQERFVWNKLITGAFRVGVSSELVIRALAQVSGVPGPTISHRLMGDWQPTGLFYEGLLGENTPETDLSRPYPFCLAHPLEQEPANLGEVDDWHVEWKWDGIRAQIIRRDGKSFVWSRGEELISDRFPEIVGICESLPDGTVLDGEIMAWAEGKPLKFMELQKRIGRKTLTRKILQEVPVVLVAFDLLEFAGEDLRNHPLRDRREMLERLVDTLNEPKSDGFAGLLGLKPQRADHFDRPTQVDARLAVESSEDEDGRPEDVREGKVPMVVQSNSRLLLAARVMADSWDELQEVRSQARSLNVEGFMLKRLDSPYLVGRKKGFWWKWKIEPLTVDAVMVYAQRGSGKRASLYTDYTFAVWNEGKLVPFAKAYSGLTDEEIRRVDNWVRRHTVEKFGPVRTVAPELVMELAFEGIQLSSRHKSGIAVRFPRILRWRHDKKAEEADSLDTVKEMLNAES